MTAVQTNLIQPEKAPLTTPKILPPEWLEPRLVAITAIALLGSVLAEQAQLPHTLITILNVISYLAGGYFGAQTAIKSLVVKRKLDVDMLMVLAAIGAALVDQWHEGAMLLFLFSLSNVLQDYAIGRSRKAIQSLFKLYPETANVKRGDQVVTVKLNDIQLNDILLIKPGERIAVDGIVVSGQSAINESAITGESMPVDKGVGDKVFAGTLNEQGILDVQANKPANQTTLARIIKMVEEAQDTKAPTEQFLDKFEQYYATFVIIATILFIVIPPLLLKVDFNSNFYRAMVLMTVASPCALVISVPASYISAIASSARMGVLLKGGAFLEQLANVKAIAFDKTGTLTIGEPRVTDVVPYGVSETELLQIAASVESRSEHPLAKAILQRAKEQQIALSDFSDFKAVVGRGIQAKVNNATILIGSITFLAQDLPLTPEMEKTNEAFQSVGKTTMGVVRDGKWLGIIAMADQLRPNAPQIIADLQAQGVEVVMLTGDHERVAKAIASQVGIKDFRAGLMPEDKVNALKELMTQYGVMGMVGDGVNDAPALATAAVGIAMGGAGSDVAMETADVVLMGDKIERIVNAIQLAHTARRVVWQNITFSVSVIVLLVFGAFAIQLPLPLGVLGHEGSTVLVVMNGLIQLLILPEIARRKLEHA